ncbi:hypothetical protein CKJ84_02820 [Corynebacterium sp. NML 120412]|nr:hypothetical protein CKJ84_02820 [Corynebacterium sp. NML 120412]
MSAPVALSLASCDALDVVGPRPNADLVALAQQAVADEQALGDAPLAHTRAMQAQQLFDEVERLCGTTESGELPSTCKVERTPGESAGNPDEVSAADHAADALTEAAADVPEESVALVTAQAIDLRVAAGTEPAADADSADSEITNEADLDAAREMLRREYAAQYGFSMATAYADDALDQHLEALRDASDERVRALVTALEPSGDVPEAAPGYAFEGVPAPADVASAGAYTQTQQQALVDQWRATAANAESPQFRRLAIQLAAEAQGA